VSTYWTTYTGAIDAALARGNVILAYWAYTGGKPQSTSAFYAMWDKVVAAYGSNPSAYFEVINEPSGYAATDLRARDRLSSDLFFIEKPWTVTDLAMLVRQVLDGSVKQEDLE
jgi:hypothetical protein